MLKSKFRVEVPGANSIFVSSYEVALEQASVVMARNGFGYIHAIGTGPSRLVARFAPCYGVVPA
jgi:hypothetical protein